MVCFGSSSVSWSIGHLPIIHSLVPPGPKPIKIYRYLKHNDNPIYGTMQYINTHKPLPLAALVAEALATQHKPSQDKLDNMILRESKTLGHTLIPTILEYRRAI